MVRLGQNFLADPNLLAAIVRGSAVGPDDVVLEVGAGEGVLTERLADQVRHLHVIEIDRGLAPHLDRLAERPGVDLHWADAMKFDLAGLDPPPNAFVANLPYAVATPLLINSIEQLPSLTTWTVMVQLEIADRLRSAPGSKTYGSPSVIVQWACEARLLRRVDRAVFRPRPRVDSAVLGLRRLRPGPDPQAHWLIRAAFAHRRKSLARSVELVEAGTIEPLRAALAECGLDPGIRAEALSADQFRELSAAFARRRPRPT